MKIIRIRIYSKANGYQDFAGSPQSAHKNERLAREAVAAYLKAGIEARYVGVV